jgi:hypothetical protein
MILVDQGYLLNSLLRADIYLDKQQIYCGYIIKEKKTNIDFK